MNDVLKEECGASLIDLDDEDGIERTLKRLTCPPTGERLLKELVKACEAERKSGILLRKTASSIEQVSPIEVSNDRVLKWAGLMDAASRSATEKRLGSLAPMKMSNFSKMRCSVAMDMASSENGTLELMTIEKSAKKHFLSYSFFRIAATLVLLLVSLSLITIYNRNGGDIAENSSEQPAISKGTSGYLVGIPSAELNRQTMRVVEEGVNWSNDQGEAQKEYQVYFEDSVRVTDKKGHRVVVSVPKSQKVIVPVQVY